MKTRAFFLTALVAAMLSAASAHAGEHTRSETGGKLGVGGGAVIGAVIGGPAGAIVGAGLGGFLGDRLQLAASVDDLQASLESSRSEIEDLGVVLDAEREQLQSMRHERARLDERIARLEQRQSMAEGLQLAVLFRTGSSQLDADAAARIERLAALLEQDPDLTVRLDGYADPRGEDEFNLAWSAERAAVVREALLGRGIAAGRVRVQAHGRSLSVAPDGDVDAYALERRVSISLGTGPDEPPDESIVAQER
jgi:outer membrane protein OmpA-like peptidoglycan-associated protein